MRKRVELRRRTRRPEVALDVLEERLRRGLVRVVLVPLPGRVHLEGQPVLAASEQRDFRADRNQTRLLEVRRVQNLALLVGVQVGERIDVGRAAETRQDLARLGRYRRRPPQLGLRWAAVRARRAQRGGDEGGETACRRLHGGPPWG